MSFKKRASESAVKQFFKDNGGVMVCQVKVQEDDSMASSSSSRETHVCGAQIRVSLEGVKHGGTRLCNLKKHLERFHSNEFELVKKQDSEKASGSTNSKTGVNILYISF
jgi:hypothetical protein